MDAKKNVLHTDAFYSAPADACVSIGAPVETHVTGAVSSPEGGYTSVDTNDLSGGFNRSASAEVVSPADEQGAPRSSGSTVCDDESDLSPGLPDSSSRYDYMHDAPPAARPVVVAPARNCDGGSYYSSSQGSYYSSSQETYYSSSYSESPENSPPQPNRKPAWIGVDSASIRPHVAAEMDGMLRLLVASPINVTLQYVKRPKGKAAAGAKAVAKGKPTGKAKRKAKGKAKAVPKMKSMAQAQRRPNVKVNAPATAASKPIVGAPAVGSVTAPSLGAPGDKTSRPSHGYGCSKCCYRSHGVPCKKADKVTIKPDCLKMT